MTFSGSQLRRSSSARPGSALHFEQLMQAAPAQVAIHQQHAGPGKSQRAGQVGGNGGFALAGHCAGDQEDFGPLALGGKKEQGRTKTAIRFGVSMPRIVQFQQAQGLLALPGHFRQQPDNGISKSGIHLADRRETVIALFDQENDSAAESQARQTEPAPPP